MRISGVEQFRRWIEERLSSQPRGASLGTARDMARQWGISLRSVERALSTYRDAGRIIRVRRRGTFVGPDLTARSPPEPAKPTSAERIAASMRESISAGRLRIGDILPSVKNTTSRYRVAASTAVQAYRILIDQGLVEKTGKRFTVGTQPETMGRRGGKVWLFSAGRYGRGTLFTSDHYAVPYRCFENELRHHGCLFGLEKVNALEERVREWIRGDQPPYGVVVSGLTREIMPTVESSLKKLLSAFPRTRIPVLLDSHFTHWSALKGEITVISRPRVWRTMVKSLCTQLVQWGRQRAVVWDLFNDPKELQSMFTAGMEEVQDRFEFVFEDTRHTDMGRPEFEDYLRNNAEVPPYVPHYLESHPVYRLLPWEKAAVLSAPAFDRRFEERNCRLWICVSDICAASVLSWTRMRGVAVPDDLALIGFDNDPRFYHLGISSMSPEWERLGYLMAHAILGDFKVAGKGHRFLHSTGQLIVRDST